MALDLVNTILLLLALSLLQGFLVRVFGKKSVYQQLVSGLLFAGAWLYWPGVTGPDLLDDRTSVMVGGDLSANPDEIMDFIFGDTSGLLGRSVSMATFALEKLYLDQGMAGDNVGVLLRGTKREEVERGQVLAKPGSITPHTKFEAEVYILTKEEGGRHTPFFKGYRPQFYFRTTDVTGAVELPEGTEMVMPGDNVQMVVELIAPIAMEDGLRFAIREGGRTVGAGVVAKIIE